MLSRPEENRLMHQLRNVLTQFVDSDRKSLVDAVVKLCVDVINLVSTIEERYDDVGDDASCGPDVADDEVYTPSNGNSPRSG